jgi:hypothetical protein
MPSRVPVEIRGETPKAWLYRVIRPGFPRSFWIAKSAATFEPDDALSQTPSGVRIRAGYLTLPGDAPAKPTENA